MNHEDDKLDNPYIQSNVWPTEVEMARRLVYIQIYILSVYSPFSDRVGHPLHNIHIPSPFPFIMDIFFVDLKVGHIRFYTL